MQGRIDQQFITAVQEHNFPAPRFYQQHLPEISKADFLDLFFSQLLARHIDLQARILKHEQRGFYTIGSSGHEGNAAVAKAARLDDIALLHYRSAAFMLQRAKQKSGYDEVHNQLLSLCAASKDPISGGRHKVFGSKILNVLPQTSTIASHLPRAVGLALSITRAKELKIKHPVADDSVVLCSFGDGSMNHASAQSALNTAQWLAHESFPLPLVFICEDNGLAISVPTPRRLGCASYARAQ